MHTAKASRGESSFRGKGSARLHSQAGASPPRLSAARRESGSRCPWLGDKIFSRNTVDEFTRATDELILGYNYLALELLRRFSDKNPGKLFFVIQKQDTLADNLKNPPKQQTVQQNIGLITSMAQSAFRTFAENVAAENFKPNGSFIYLLEVTSEISENEILSWIATKMQEDFPVYKNPKNAVTWQSTENKNKFPFMK